MEQFLTKNTKNGKEQDGPFTTIRTPRRMDVTIVKRTNEDGTIKLKAIVLERDGMILKKLERVQP